jgi:alcohol dehydrogenase class IV
MEVRYSSIIRAVKVEISIKDLSIDDRLNLLNSLLEETGITRALFEAFGREEITRVVDTAFKAYEAE